MVEKRISATTKLRQYFLTHIGTVLDSETLRRVAETSEWARRVRELRRLEGYKILTYRDRDDLKPNQYLLEDPIPDRAHIHVVSKKNRAFVLDRDGFTCQSCGVSAGEIHPYDNRRVQLQMGHIDENGPPEPDNLWTLCSVCNEGAADLTLTRPDSTKLLSQIRRAPREDQLKVLAALVRKFPRQVTELIPAETTGENVAGSKNKPLDKKK